MRKLLAALTATFLVVVGTGVYQAFRYRPDLASAWPGQAVRTPEPGVLYQVTDVVHRWASFLFLFFLLAVAVGWARRNGGGARRWRANVALAVAAVAAIAAVVTGPLLQWDQLALFAVTAGERYEGVVGLRHVRFLLRGAREVSFDDFNRMVWLHVVALPVVIVGALGVVWFVSARDRRARAGGEGIAETKGVHA